MAEYLRAALAESADKQMKQLKSRIHPVTLGPQFTLIDGTQHIYDISES